MDKTKQTDTTTDGPTLHGIPLSPVTDRGEREYLGTRKGLIEIGDYSYTVWPRGDGTADLFGTGPRTNPWSEGGDDWQHAPTLRLDARGRITGPGDVVTGYVRDGQYVARPIEEICRDLGV